MAPVIRVVAASRRMVVRFCIFDVSLGWVVTGLQELLARRQLALYRL